MKQSTDYLLSGRALSLCWMW